MPERRDSVPDFAHKKPYKPSLVSSRKTRAMTSYEAGTDRNMGTDTTTKSKNDGTESTMSTTAPSTVWDELDDLKSRIRKLELTGKLPSSSAAAMSSMAGERPRTATTTVTTVSSSPKHKQKASSNSPPRCSTDTGRYRSKLHGQPGSSSPPHCPGQGKTGSEPGGLPSSRVYGNGCNQPFYCLDFEHATYQQHVCRYFGQHSGPRPASKG